MIVTMMLKHILAVGALIPTVAAAAKVDGSALAKQAFMVGVNTREKVLHCMHEGINSTAYETMIFWDRNESETLSAIEHFENARQTIHSSAEEARQLYVKPYGNYSGFDVDPREIGEWNSESGAKIGKAGGAGKLGCWTPVTIT